MKKTLRPIALTLTALLTLTCLFSCARSAKNESMDMMYDGGMEMQSAAIESGMTDKPTSAGSVLSGSATADSATATAEFASKIIKTVHMDTETKEFDRAIAELDRLITENGGFIESASTNGQSLYQSDVYRRSAKYTVRIPAEKLNTFLAASEQLLNVTYSNTASQNVTTEYYDIQSRLEVLRSERDALSAMLDKADTVENMLNIRERLYNVIEEIEAHETQLRLYDSLVSYSTVHLNIDEVVEYTEIKIEEPTWGERLADAFTESWKDFAEGFQDFTVSLLYAIPTLMVLGVIAAVVLVIVLTIVRRQRRAREEQRAAYLARRGTQQNTDHEQK